MRSASVDSPPQMQALRRRTWTGCGAAGRASPCVTSASRGRRPRQGPSHRSHLPARSQRASALVTALRSSASVGSLATAPSVTATSVTAPVTALAMALRIRLSSAGAAVRLWASSLTSFEAGLLAGRVAGSCQCGDGAFEQPDAELSDGTLLYCKHERGRHRRSHLLRTPVRPAPERRNDGTYFRSGPGDSSLLRRPSPPSNYQPPLTTVVAVRQRSVTDSFTNREVAVRSRSRSESSR